MVKLSEERKTRAETAPTALTLDQPYVVLLWLRHCLWLVPNYRDGSELAEFDTKMQRIKTLSKGSVNLMALGAKSEDALTRILATLVNGSHIIYMNRVTIQD